MSGHPSTPPKRIEVVGPLLLLAFASGTSCIVSNAQDEYEQCVVALRCLPDGGAQPGDGGGSESDGGAADAGSDGGSLDAGGVDGGAGDGGAADAGAGDAGTSLWPPTGWTNPRSATPEFPPGASFPTVADDGQTLCYRTQPPRSGPRLECKLLDGGLFGPAITSTSTEAVTGTDYALSSDGSRLYFTVNGYEVKWVPLTNGMTMASGMGAIGGSGATSPAVQPGTADHLFAVDVFGQIMEKTSNDVEMWLPSPINDGVTQNVEVDVAPSGDFILYTRDDNGSLQLMAARRESGAWQSPTQLGIEGLDPAVRIAAPELLRDGRLLFVGKRLDGAGVEVLYADPKP